MDDQSRISATQNHTLHYVARYETPEYGVVVRYGTAETLMRRGYLREATRRRFARETGICVRLTDQGKVWVDGYR